jgi:transposase InsO family protein
MKTEMYYQHYFDNHLAARTAVLEYIESWYNRRRPHSHLDSARRPWQFNFRDP